MKKLPMIGVLAAAGVAALGGCSAGKVDYARAYPYQTARGEPRSIQVLRDETHITMTNTTARGFGPSTLWLNRWYSRPIDGFAVGETITLRLSEFRDSTSEPFRGGGFWASQQPMRIISADLESDGELVGLVVIADRN